MARTRRKKQELPVTALVMGFVVLLLIVRFRPQALVANEHVMSLGSYKGLDDYVADRIARDAAAHTPHVHRELTKKSKSTLVDLGTPCVQQLNKEVDISGPSNLKILGEQIPKFVCTTHLSPLMDHKQCCCKKEVEAGGLTSNEVRCLPSFIVIGAQKSGTTALMGFLITHPNFAPPVNKEIHFFDQSRKFRRGINWYITRFPATTTPTTHITAEDTPAYIYASHAMSRMQQGLGTHARDTVRFVVMLRNPTDRTYSEYQMHMRRYAQEKTGWERFKELWPQISSCLINKKLPGAPTAKQPDRKISPAKCFLNYLPQFQVIDVPNSFHVPQLPLLPLSIHVLLLSFFFCCCCCCCCFFTPLTTRASTSCIF